VRACAESSLCIRSQCIHYQSLLLRQSTGCRYSEKGQVHLAVILLGVAAAVQTLAVILELLHLVVFSRNGMGLRWRHSWFPADFYSEVLQDLSELLCALVLIALAFGWTIPDPDLVMNPTSRNSFLAGMARPAEWLRKLTPASVFVLTLVASNILLEILGRGFEDDFNQFHDHEHWPGYTLMLMRVGLALLFAFGILRSRTSEAVRAAALRVRVHIRVRARAYATHAYVCTRMHALLCVHRVRRRGRPL
jgi:hypothetical protein